jgi:hypothetical protein
MVIQESIKPLVGWFYVYFGIDNPFTFMVRGFFYRRKGLKENYKFMQRFMVQGVFR